MINDILNTFLFTIYNSLIIVSMYAVYLYRKAYYEMKCTKIIRSVYFLLITILIEQIYFGIVSLISSLGLENTYSILMNPFFWSLPKLTLLIGLCYFIHSSLNKNQFIQ